MTRDSQTLRIGTQGWDMVSCATVPDLNAAIVEQHSSPPGFEATRSGATIKGTFGEWQVGNDGSGYLVHLALPMRGVSIGNAGEEWTVARATAHIEVNLHFVPKKVAGLRSGIQLFDLCVDSGGESGITVLGVTVEEGRDDVTTRAVINVCLKDWLDRNLASFSHIFATIQVWSEESEKEHPWLRPTSKSYAFCSLSDPASSFLAVLAQTQNRSDKKLINQVSADTLVQPYERSIMISHNRFARDMLLPAIVRSFPGLKPQDLGFEDNDTRIKLLAPKLIKGVDVKKKTYSVMLQQMDIEIQEEGFELNATTQSEVSPGIYSNCRSSGRYTVVLVDRPDGKQTLGIKQLSPITPPRHWSSHAKWIDDIQDILWLLSLVGIAMIGLLTEGVGAVVAIIVICLLLGGPIAAVTIKMIEDVHKNDAPPLNLLIADASAAVSWPSVDGFIAKAVDIIGGVRISGFSRTKSFAHG